LAQLKQDISKKARERTAKIRKSRHLVPIFSAVFVVAMFLFLQYNRLIFASVEAYVSPGNSSAQNTIQAPNSSAAAEGEKLIIPKINVDVPINYGFGNDHASQMKAMETGVSHFAISGANSVPGQAGNVVLSGHSSNDLFDNGEYKFIFAQLEKMTEGDTIYVNHEGVRYSYVVRSKEVVLPTEVSKVIRNDGKSWLTLITCTPLGTAQKRLLVFAEQVSPSPASNKQIITRVPTQNNISGLTRNTIRPRNRKVRNTSFHRFHLRRVIVSKTVVNRHIDIDFRDD
jgi:sortase A